MDIKYVLHKYITGMMERHFHKHLYIFLPSEKF